MSEATTEAAAAEELDILGPVDWIVVEFPGAKFDGSVLPELLDLEERGIIRVLDLVVLKKDADGTIEACSCNACSCSWVADGFRSKTTCFTVPVKAYGAFSSYARSTTRPLSRPTSMPVRRGEDRGDRLRRGLPVRLQRRGRSTRASCARSCGARGRWSAGKASTRAPDEAWPRRSGFVQPVARDTDPMSLRRNLYAVVGFVAVLIGRRVLTRKARKALHRR